MAVKMAHPVRGMYTCAVTLYTHTHTHTSMYIARGSVHSAVHREAYTVSQSTSPSDPFVDCQVGFYDSSPLVSQ